MSLSAEMLASIPPPEFLAGWEIPEPIAFHESGHACVSLALGVPVFYATIQPTYECGGHVSHARLDTIEELPILIVLTLAGMAAETVYGHPGDGTWDIPLARCAIAVLHHVDQDSDMARTYLARWATRAVREVQREQAWIERVAIDLQRWKRLTGDEILQLRDSPATKVWQ